MGTFFLSIDVIADAFHEIFFERTCADLNIPSVDETPEEYNIWLSDGMINLFRGIWVTVNAKTLQLQNIIGESKINIKATTQNVAKKNTNAQRKCEITLRRRLRNRDFTHPTQSRNSSSNGAERTMRRKHLYLAPYGKDAKSQLQSKSVLLVSCGRSR
jgi:hypothetical protein